MIFKDLGFRAGLFLKIHGEVLLCCDAQRT